MKMKKWIAGFAVFAASLLLSVTAYAQIAPAMFNLVLNGTAVTFGEDAQPININGRTLLPLKTLFDLLNTDGTGSLAWDEQARMVTLAKGETTVKLWIDDSMAQVNGKPVEIDGAAPVLYGDRTYVPLRFVADAFGMYISWEPLTATAGLMDKAIMDQMVAVFTADVGNDYAPLSMDLKIAIDASMQMDDKTPQSFGFIVNGLMQYAFEQSFIHVDMDVTIKEESEGIGTTYESSAHMYDDGINSYTQFGTAQYDKRGSQYKYLFDMASAIPSDGEEFAEAMAYLGIDAATPEEYLASQLESLGINLHLLAGLSITRDASGNTVIEGNIPLPVGLINTAIREAMYLSEDEFDFAMTKPLHIRYVTNASNIPVAMELSGAVRVSVDDSWVPGAVSAEFYLGITNIQFPASFETVIPEDVVKNAFDWDAYYEELYSRYEGYDNGYDENGFYHEGGYYYYLNDSDQGIPLEQLSPEALEALHLNGADLSKFLTGTASNENVLTYKEAWKE